MEDRGTAILKALKEVVDRKDALSGIRQAAQLAQDILERKEKPTMLAFPAAQAPPAAPTELEGRSMAGWLNDLKNPDASVRERAISALPSFGEAVAGTLVIGNLIGCTADADASPKMRALQVLNAMPIKPAESQRVVQCLAGLLVKKESALVRYEAAMGLIRFGEDAHSAVPALASFASDAMSWEIRRACLAALMSAGRNGGKAPNHQAITAMIHGSKDVTAEVRLAAAMGLGALGRTTDPALKPLVEAALNKLVKDHDERVVIWAKVAQMALAGHDDRYGASIAALVRSPEVPVRMHAVKAIGAMGPKGKFAQDKILDAVNDKEPSVQLAAFATLVAMEDRGPNVLNALREQAERKDAPEYMRQAAQAAHDLLRKGRK